MKMSIPLCRSKNFIQILRNATGFVFITLLLLCNDDMFAFAFKVVTLPSGRPLNNQILGSNVFQSKTVNRFCFELSQQYSRPSLFTPLLQLSSQNSAVIEAAEVNEVRKTPVPVVLLAGFLGTGKTSTLKHLLENKVNLKVGVIVNDVASVNIDAKLIAGSSTAAMDAGNDNKVTNKDNIVYDLDATTFVDLQNGCVCCSLADELFFSVENLIQQRGKSLDLIVIELSGVGDPIAIKNNWIMAPKIIQEMASLTKIITIIDTSTFGMDYMTWDIAMDRPNWIGSGHTNTNNNDDIYNDMESNNSGSMRKVAELLAEQVEAADLILINKIDLADDDQRKVAVTVVSALNSKAKIEFVQHGRIQPMKLLEDNLKKVILDHEEKQHDEHHHDHSHHSHKHDEKDESVTETMVSSSTTVVDCTAPGCTDSSHSHDHTGHEPSTSSSTDVDCTVPGCTDTSHSHDHTGHEHSHTHNNQNMINNDIGLLNFVYKSTRPFHAGRLMNLLNEWPVPIKDVLDISMLQNATRSTAYEVQGKKTRKSSSPFIGVLRSKGFCWFAPYQWTGRDADIWRHDTAMYWSHAGKQFGISSAGKWWDTVPPELMKKYFLNNNKEYDRIIQDDFVSKEFGDRRQEIVFIGTNSVNETKIWNVLDSCLLNDTEMEQYKQQLYNRNLLSSSSPIL